MDKRKPPMPDLVPAVDKADFENQPTNGNEMHKNFGKVPKYLQTYQKEAQEKEQLR
mgnify:CR=1 FL=1